jgi:hypothetical protein
MTPPNNPQPPEKGDAQSPLGREGEQIAEGAAADAATSHYPRKASVVIRASVEHIGLVGETELTVNVKWPASTFCVQPGGKPATQATQTEVSPQVPGNGPLASNFDTLYGEASADPKPALGAYPSGSSGSTEN